MWPWEHLLLGYLVFSVSLRTLRRSRPARSVADLGVTGHSVGVLGVATQLPDLVDKPLAWQFQVFDGGFALAHSVFVAVPVALLALLVSVFAGRLALGVAVAAGYLSHLAGDLIFTAVVGGDPSLDPVLWPFVTAQPSASPGFLAQVQTFVIGFLGFLTTPAGVLYLVAEASLVLVTLLLWAADDYPGVGTVRRLAGSLWRATS